MKKITKTLLPLLLCICLLTACVGTTPPDEIPEKPEQPTEIETETAAPDPADLYEPFVPVVRFAVVSDVHVHRAADNCAEAERFRKLIELSYAYSHAQEAYQTLDALVVAGDLTLGGTADEVRNFKSIVTECLTEETTLIPMLGNHEHYGNIKAYQSIVERELNLHKVINGFHFIAVSPDGNDYDDEDVEFLKTELAAAAADAPDKPIFAFQHHNLKNTVYGSFDDEECGGGTDSTPGLRSAYDDYPQIFLFTGHTHVTMNHPRDIYQDNFTMLALGTLCNLECADRMTDGYIPSGSGTVGQFYIVEVNADNVVKIMPYNIITEDFMKTPSNTDDPDKQLVYYVKTPAGKEDFDYTAEKYNSSCFTAPHFTDDAAVTFSDITATSAVASIPQALDDSCIYNYRLVYTGPDGSANEITFYSRFFEEPLCDTLSHILPDLTPDSDYTVSVYPINAWKLEGEPITGTFHTAAE